MDLLCVVSSHLVMYLEATCYCGKSQIVHVNSYMYACMLVIFNEDT
jgi:hypothetical protein